MADVHPVLQHLINSEFRDLEGAVLEGQLCLTDDAVNLGLREVIKDLTSSDTPGERTGEAVPSSPLPDPSIFTKKVKVSRLNYRTEKGKTTIELRARLGK
jgi:hypothetical protein